MTTSAQTILAIVKFFSVTVQILESFVMLYFSDDDGQYVKLLKFNSLLKMNPVVSNLFGF